MTTKWRNWAGTASSQPIIEVAPRTVEQVVLAVQRARETGYTLKAIGASHSFTAIGATDGVRVRMEGLRGLVDVDLERGRVTLWAGTHLWELPGILDPLGLALRNMGDVDRQTISGAISTGTHGTGITLGGLSTQVVGATLVTGTGEVLEIDEQHNAELLPAVALGLGALGVLLTVTIQCVPRFLLRAVEAPASFAHTLEHYEELNRSADHFEFYWFPHTESVRTKTNTRLPMESGARPLGTVAKFLDQELVNNVMLGAVVGFQRFVPQATPSINRTIETVSSSRDYSDISHRVFVTKRRVKFRELEYAVPFAAVPTAMRELRKLVERKKYRISFPIEARTAAADNLLLSTAHGRESGYIAVHRYRHDPDQGYFREAEAILKAHDGRPHWGKMHTRDADSLRDSYPRFAEFLAIRDRLDPDRVFSNPYLRRVLGS